MNGLILFGMNDQDLDHTIARLGKTLLTENVAAFEAEAARLAVGITAKDFAALAVKLHQSPPHLPGTPVEQLGLGQWMAVCQYVIFELVYHVEHGRIDFLRQFAFGEYDWTQANALENLCRLSLEGKISPAIVAEINEKLEGMRYETHAYFINALLSREKRDARYTALIEQLDNEAFRQVLEERVPGRKK